MQMSFQEVTHGDILAVGKQRSNVTAIGATRVTCLTDHHFLDGRAAWIPMFDGV
jgi:hypothetical protein